MIVFGASGSGFVALLIVLVRMRYVRDECSVILSVAHRSPTLDSCKRNTDVVQRTWSTRNRFGRYKCRIFVCVAHHGKIFLPQILLNLTENDLL